MKKYKVVVDIAPRTIDGTKGCHEYVWDYYKTKREANHMAQGINSPLTGGHLGVARVEKR